MPRDAVAMNRERAAASFMRRLFSGCCGIGRADGCHDAECMNLFPTETADQKQVSEQSRFFSGYARISMHPVIRQPALALLENRFVVGESASTWFHPSFSHRISACIQNFILKDCIPTDNHTVLLQHVSDCKPLLQRTPLIDKTPGSPQPSGRICKAFRLPFFWPNPLLPEKAFCQLPYFSCLPIHIYLTNHNISVRRRIFLTPLKQNPLMFRRKRRHIPGRRRESYA